ncbi:tetratricopeptide repeat protein, partial [Streptomyces microflavus]
SSQFGVQSSMYASFLAARGRCRLHQAAVGEMRIQDAEVDLLAAVKLLRATVGPERAQLASALINLSSTFSLEGRWKEALSVAKEAYEEDLRRFGPDHPETQFDLHFLNVIAMQFDVAQRFHLGDESSGD